MIRFDKVSNARQGDQAIPSHGVMRHAMGRLVEGMLSLLFPPRCEVCGLLREPVLCDACRAGIEVITAPYCQQCGLPFDPALASASHCATCRNDPPAFDAARAAARYDGVLRRAIHLFKYDTVPALAPPLASLMRATIELPISLDLLCPVPLHPLRLRMRGFNQSLLLAESLGVAWHLPVVADALTRVRQTAPQMSLPFDERRRNIRGAFATQASVAGCTVGLVDDVYTTGSTLRECSRVLRRAGATRIVVLTVARAIPTDAMPLPREKKNGGSPAGVVIWDRNTE